MKNNIYGIISLVSILSLLIAMSIPYNYGIGIVTWASIITGFIGVTKEHKLLSIISLSISGLILISGIIMLICM